MNFTMNFAMFSFAIFTFFLLLPQILELRSLSIKNTFKSGKLLSGNFLFHLVWVKTHIWGKSKSI